MKQVVVVVVMAVAACVVHASDEPLPAERAFVPSVKIASEKELVLSVEVEKGHALYADRIKVKGVDGAVDPAIEVQNPEKLEKLRGKVVVHVKTDQPITGVAMRAQFQGCSDSGICYAPMSVQIVDGQVKGKQEGGLCNAIPLVRGYFC